MPQDRLGRVVCVNSTIVFDRIRVEVLSVPRVAEEGLELARLLRFVAALRVRRPRLVEVVHRVLLQVVRALREDALVVENLQCRDTAREEAERLRLMVLPLDETILLEAGFRG